MVSKKNHDKDIFKINLLSMLSGVYYDIYTSENKEEIIKFEKNESKEQIKENKTVKKDIKEKISQEDILNKYYKLGNATFYFNYFKIKDNDSKKYVITNVNSFIVFNDINDFSNISFYKSKSISSKIFEKICFEEYILEEITISKLKTQYNDEILIGKISANDINNSFNIALIQNIKNIISFNNINGNIKCPHISLPKM